MNNKSNLPSLDEFTDSIAKYIFEHTNDKDM